MHPLEAENRSSISCLSQRKDDWVGEMKSITFLEERMTVAEKPGFSPLFHGSSPKKRDQKHARGRETVDK